MDYIEVFITNLSGWKSDFLSRFSGSVINGRNAALPSDWLSTNFTADQTAILWNGVGCDSFELEPLRILKPPSHISRYPAFWFFYYGNVQSKSYIVVFIWFVKEEEKKKTNSKLGQIR